MKVLVTGATGMIGREIVKRCHDLGIFVNYLTTSKQKIKSESNFQGYYWNPKKNEIDENCLDGVDAIINLVGASISKRWAVSYKKEVLDSRTETARLLKSTIESYNYPVKHLISASAIGIYPSSDTKYYEEDYQGVSDLFLGQVVKQWEAAVDDFESIGIKVCKIRIGLVLSNAGGALPEIVKPIKFGAGAAFGNGEQWQSWIHVDDLAELFIYAYQNKLEGAYNGVAPNPVSNNDLTKIAARVLKKPLILPNIPKFAMKLALGEMHIILFESQRVSSNKIESEGFMFQFTHLESALIDLLN